MKYEELKRFVEKFEEKWALSECIYVGIIKHLKGVRKDPKSCDLKSVDRMVEFLIHYGMGRNVRRGDFSREKVMKTIHYLSNEFNSIFDENILRADFKHEKIRKSIGTIYSEIKYLPQIGPTGASKIAHLINPRLFVMWDGDIRKKIRKEGFPNAQKGYLEFLEWIQGELREALEGRNVGALRKEVKREVKKNVGFEHVKKKRLAKLADEYCFQKVHSRSD